jgi:hypothetical protein
MSPFGYACYQRHHPGLDTHHWAGAEDSFASEEWSECWIGRRREERVEQRCRESWPASTCTYTCARACAWRGVEWRRVESYGRHGLHGWKGEEWGRDVCGDRPGFGTGRAVRQAKCGELLVVFLSEVGVE